MFRNILKFETFEQAIATIRNLENIRNRFLEDEDARGLRILREVALQGKKDILAIANKPKTTSDIQAKNVEIASWLTIWLQTPDVFENWIKLRMRSSDFKQKFP